MGNNEISIGLSMDRPFGGLPILHFNKPLENSNPEHQLLEDLFLEFYK